MSGLIGAKKVINRADFPVLCRSITNVGAVNKNLYSKVHSYITTDHLTTAWSQRFRQEPLTIAAMMKTEGSLLWLDKYIKNKGYDRLFKAQKEIVALSKNIAEDLTAKNFGVEIICDEKGYNDCCNRNRIYSGLMLTICKDVCVLHMPWGYAPLFKINKSPLTSREKVIFSAAVQELCKRVSVVLRNLKESRPNAVYYKQEKDINLENRILQFNSYFKKTSAQVVAAQKGTSVLFLPNADPNYSLYEIMSVDGIDVNNGDIIYTDNEKDESWNVTSIAIQDVLANRYLARSSNGLIETVEKTNDLLVPQEKSCDSILVENIMEVPSFYIELVKKIFNESDIQPILSRDIFNNEIMKYSLRSNNHYDGKVLEYLTEIANEGVPCNQRFIKVKSDSKLNYSCINQPVRSNPEITLEVILGADVSNFDPLKNKYEQCIESLKYGWQAVDWAVNQDVEKVKSEENWTLFIKKMSSKNQAELINLLAEMLGTKDKIVACSTWVRDLDRRTGKRMKYDERRREKEIYIWVRKDSLAEVTAILGFQLGE